MQSRVRVSTVSHFYSATNIRFTWTYLALCYIHYYSVWRKLIIWNALVEAGLCSQYTTISFLLAATAGRPNAVFLGEPKLNLVHFCFKLGHQVVKILTIADKQLTNFVSTVGLKAKKNVSRHAKGGNRPVLPPKYAILSSFTALIPSCPRHHPTL